MRKLFLMLIGFLLTSSLLAGPVGKDEAQSKALAFLNGRAGTASSGKAQAPRRLQDLSLATSNEAYFVFNVGTDGGFVMVSGSDLTPTILGYADEGTFDSSNMPDNMKAWLAGYEEQIKYMEAKGVNIFAAPAMAKSSRKAGVKTIVAPLLSTLWNQDEPYNNLCPDFFTLGKSVTGCVATAMAQVLYYLYQKEGFPTGTKTDIASYSCAKNWSGLGHVSVPACPATTFDWANMQESYTGSETSTQQSAVAKLMQYCGAAVAMDYANSDNGGSSASTAVIPEALETYFGFDRNVRLCERRNYSNAEWEEVVYAELAAGRPVLYGGVSAGGGHAFVCDGYSGDGYYHINWGWGGLANSYFLLSMLNPDSEGTGGSSTYDGFTMDQQMVIGLQKPSSVTVEPGDRTLTLESIRYTGTNTISKDDASVAFSFAQQWRSNFSYTYNVTHGLRIMKDATKIEDKEILPKTVLAGVTTNSHCNMNGPGSYFFTWFPTTGTYKLKPVYKMEGASEWTLIEGADDYYLQAVVTSDLITFSAVNPSVSVAASAIALTTDGTENTVQKVKANIKNTGSKTYRSNVYMFVDGTLVAGRGIELASGADANVSFRFMAPAAGTKTVKFTTDQEGTNVIGTGSVTFSSAVVIVGTDAPALTFTKVLNLDDTETYILGNKLEATLTAKNETGSNYTGAVTLYLYKWITASSYMQMSYNQTITVPAGSSKEVTFEYPVELGAEYSVQVAYSHSGSTQTIGTEKDATYVAHDVLSVSNAQGEESMLLLDATLDLTGKDAIAVVDLRGQTTVTAVKPNANPNCLYLMDGSAATPTGISNNVVKGSTAANVVLSYGYDFYTPIDFTATAISFKRTFTTGANKSGGGWNTIVLPFDVSSVSVGGTPIDWFKSTLDTGKNFWLYQFVGESGSTVEFDYTSSLNAYTPYLINVPGDAWGTENQLTGKEITFSGSSATLKSSASVLWTGTNYLMTGSLQQTEVTDAYVMNASGTQFAKSTGTVPAFEACFKDKTKNLYTTALTIGFVNADEATGIKELKDSKTEASKADGGWFTLTGVKLTAKPTEKGIYINNGKKVIIK